MMCSFDRFRGIIMQETSKFSSKEILDILFMSY